MTAITPTKSTPTQSSPAEEESHYESVSKEALVFRGLLHEITLKAEDINKCVGTLLSQTQNASSQNKGVSSEGKSEEGKTQDMSLFSK
jgi:hypothetical protein